MSILERIKSILWPTKASLDTTAWDYQDLTIDQLRQLAMRDVPGWWAPQRIDEPLGKSKDQQGWIAYTVRMSIDDEGDVMTERFFVSSSMQCMSSYDWWHRNDRPVEVVNRGGERFRELPS